MEPYMVVFSICVCMSLLAVPVSGKPLIKTYGSLMKNLPVDQLTANNANIYLRRTGETAGSVNQLKSISLKKAVPSSRRRSARSVKRRNRRGDASNPAFVADTRKEGMGDDKGWSPYAVRRVVRVVDGQQRLTCQCMDQDGPVSWVQCRNILVDCQDYVLN